MTTYSRGEVVLVPFPFTDLSTTKRRPAIILSTETYNARRSDVIVAPVTSNTLPQQRDDCVLREWSTAGLVKPSVVKMVVGTIAQACIVRKLGSLFIADLRRVDQAIAEAMGMSGAR